MRLIDADAYAYPGDLVNEPTIDAEPIKHGRWIETNWAEHDGHGEVITYYDVKALKCSKCCHCFKEELLWRKNYCPHCGARMDLEGTA